MHWEALRWAKNNGYRWFDLGGLSEDSLRSIDCASGDGASGTDSIPGFVRFKLDFGGRVFRYPEPVELIRPAVVRHAYDWARRGSTGRKLISKAQRLLRGGLSRR